MLATQSLFYFFLLLSSHVLSQFCYLLIEVILLLLLPNSLPLGFHKVVVVLILFKFVYGVKCLEIVEDVFERFGGIK